MSVKVRPIYNEHSYQYLGPTLGGRLNSATLMYILLSLASI